MAFLHIKCSSFCMKIKLFGPAATAGQIHCTGRLGVESRRGNSALSLCVTPYSGSGASVRKLVEANECPGHHSALALALPSQAQHSVFERLAQGLSGPSDQPFLFAISSFPVCLGLGCPAHPAAPPTRPPRPHPCRPAHPRLPCPLPVAPPISSRPRPLLCRPAHPDRPAHSSAAPAHSSAAPPTPLPPRPLSQAYPAPHYIHPTADCAHASCPQSLSCLLLLSRFPRVALGQQPLSLSSHVLLSTSSR